MYRIILILIFLCTTESMFSQCQSFNVNLNQANSFCVMKPFGVGRNAGNSDMYLAERGIYFDAYQSSNGFRFRYSNYHPMSIEYHPWSNKLFFRYVDGSQATQAGVEINSWKDALTIENISGKIKIGDVSSPGNYKLYVEDGILTEKINVALKNTSDWADYVFSDDYMLLQIDSLERYVVENKKLPKLPSAKEMVETGNNLHETDRLLLEKIEELTLYIIQLNNRIKELEEKEVECKESTMVIKD